MRSACRLAKRYDEIVIELSGHSGLVVALAYSPDGRTLASASADGTARLWDLNTGKLTAMLQSPAARAYCVAFSRDGKSLAVAYGGPRGLVQLWDVEPVRRRASWAANPDTTRGLAFNSDATLLATVGDAEGAGIWRTNGGLLVRDLVAPYPPMTAVAYEPGDRFVAAVSGRPADVLVWQATDGQLYRSLRHISDWGYAITFAPDGDRIAVGLERTVAIWNPADYRRPPLWPAHAGAVLGVAFTPDGQTLLTGGADGLVKLWDPDGRLRHTFDWKLAEIGAVAFAPDGLTAAAGGYETILVWDVGE
jgi:WD40 repeat protein